MPRPAVWRGFLRRRGRVRRRMSVPSGALSGGLHTNKARRPGLHKVYALHPLLRPTLLRHLLPPSLPLLARRAYRYVAALPRRPPRPPLASSACVGAAAHNPRLRSCLARSRTFQNLLFHSTAFFSQNIPEPSETISSATKVRERSRRFSNLARKHNLARETRRVGASTVFAGRLVRKALP